MKVFISQPMKGKSEAEIKAERERVCDWVKATAGEDVEFLDSWLGDELSGLTGEPHALWCLGESLKIMAQADVAVFAEGFGWARGCMMEYKAAELYGIAIWLAGWGVRLDTR